jgi:hypothetical protein
MAGNRGPLHVALEFSSLRVEFLHEPFAMKVYRNGVVQSKDYKPEMTPQSPNDVPTSRPDAINGWSTGTRRLFPATSEIGTCLSTPPCKASMTP